MAAVPEIDMPFGCDVYEPAEDTFLFLDALQDELAYIASLKPSFCAEIGYVIHRRIVLRQIFPLRVRRPVFGLMMSF